MESRELKFFLSFFLHTVELVLLFVVHPRLEVASERLGGDGH